MTTRKTKELYIVLDEWDDVDENLAGPYESLSEARTQAIVSATENEITYKVYKLTFIGKAIEPTESQWVIKDN